jgi:hypothetical protein
MTQFKIQITYSVKGQGIMTLSSEALIPARWRAYVVAALEVPHVPEGNPLQQMLMTLTAKFECFSIFGDTFYRDTEIPPRPGVSGSELRHRTR